MSSFLAWTGGALLGLGTAGAAAGGIRELAAEPTEENAFINAWLTFGGLIAQGVGGGLLCVAYITKKPTLAQRRRAGTTGGGEAGDDDETTPLLTSHQPATFVMASVTLAPDVIQDALDALPGLFATLSDAIAALSRHSSDTADAIRTVANLKLTVQLLENQLPQEDELTPALNFKGQQYSVPADLKATLECHLHTYIIAQCLKLFATYNSSNKPPDNVTKFTLDQILKSIHELRTLGFEEFDETVDEIPVNLSTIKTTIRANFSNSLHTAEMAVKNSDELDAGTVENLLFGNEGLATETRIDAGYSRA